MARPPVSETSVVQRSPDQVSADLGDGYVILSFASGQYIGLDGVASAIWERIDEPLSVGDVCEAVASDFDVTSSACQDDVVGFLNEMLDEGLVTVVEG
jgi:hypothetical protein